MATLTLTKDNIEETIERNDVVLLDFWASWCGPCRAFAPTFEAASEKYPSAVFGKIDTEDQRELAAGLQITSIPTLMIFRENILVFRQPGALPPGALNDLIDKVLELDMDDVRRQIAEHEAGHEHGPDCNHDHEDEN